MPKLLEPKIVRTFDTFIVETGVDLRGKYQPGDKGRYFYLKILRPLGISTD